MENVNLLSAIEAARAIRDGMITSEELVKACLSHIQALEGDIGAWAHLDPEYALEQARSADTYRRQGSPLGPLHGVPVGIKDIIDTADMPTECGTVLHKGRNPSEDASLVALLREAGAIILGKTVTAELATFAPGKTRNPHNLEHTPGGSSSGSAAAVAAGMVPLSVGTQTGGSVIRPAAFCGIFGFKPTHGRISRHRVLAQSQVLDTVGVYGRTLEDIALIADVLMAYDSRDSSMKPHARLDISQIMTEEPPVPPRFGFVRTPNWDKAEDSTKDAFRDLIDELNNDRETVDLVKLPAVFDDISDIQNMVMEADIAKSFAKLYEDGKDQLSPQLCGQIERGRKITAVDYNIAVERVQEFNGILESILEEYDALLTPSTPGEAPRGLETTGNPIFNSLWTLCGVPALNLPIMEGPNGLPLGVQLISYKGDDARLLRNARWLLNKLDAQ